MPIKEAGARFTSLNTPCSRCGHPRLEKRAQRRGGDRLWLAYCPSCRCVAELAAIPEWFCRGLPVPPPEALH